VDSLRFDEDLSPHGLRFAVIAARFNAFVVDKLLSGALEALEGAEVETYRVPGAWELPLAAQAAAESGNFDAIVCLGCVIRGGTSHFDYVAGECARGLQDVQLKIGLPVIFGVLTTDTVAQAEERIGKGADAAKTAIEMARLMAALRNGD
jgi:6,7-dimethyl-8-ribityllumazine synthase